MSRIEDYAALKVYAAGADDGRIENAQSAELPFLARVSCGVDPEHRCGENIEEPITSGARRSRSDSYISIRSELQLEHEGAGHCAELFESFFIDNADGKHLVLALEVLGVDITEFRRSFDPPRLSLDSVKKILRQTLLALDYIHTECGIIHCGQHRVSAV